MIRANGIIEILLPSFCLICESRIRGATLCHRCRPKSILDTPIPRCLRCFSPCSCPDTEGVCEACRVFPLPYESVRWLWEYDESSQPVIAAMKYRPSRKLTRFAAELLAERIDQLWIFNEWDSIVPIPPSKMSIEQRPFSIPGSFAQFIRDRLPNRPKVLWSALTHCGYRAPQASLSHTERLRNVQGAFKGTPGTVEGHRVLLVDDVITTGATTAIAAKELLNVGASSVSLIALARASVWEQHRGPLSLKLS